MSEPPSPIFPPFNPNGLPPLPFPGHMPPPPHALAMGQPRGPWQAASPAIPFVPDAIPFVPDEAPVPEGPGKIVEAGHYVSRWQLWNERHNRWCPFDPDSLPKDVLRDYPNARFIINIRHKKPYGDPELVLSDFSKPIIAFMRAAVGNQFFNDKPECPVVEIFIAMKDIRRKQARARELVEDEAGTDYVKEVEKLGYIEATKPATTREMCKAYVTELVDHLEPFVKYMNEQFAPLEAKLARLHEYGQLEFDVLLYHFEPGMKLVVSDCATGGSDASVLLGRSIGRDIRGRFVMLDGYAYRFNGDQYAKRSVQTRIYEFKGTRPVDSLAAMEMSVELEEKLKERGQLYTTLAGIHHKEYLGNRIILDPKAYSNREGYTRDPQAVIRPLDENLLYLLPPGIEGFNLANKVCQECQRLGYPCPPEDCQTWQKFDITKVRDVVFDEGAWDHLVLDSETKLLLEALVRVTENATTTDAIIADVISGKGGGLISVLHGPPGTGKTLTAESIAEHLHRPMYMVGFAELSTTPNNLEPNLRRILSLATAWDAVLLIDEADVFLEQRSLHELERNALVSVALRLLEYHRGVLFLTTNRITTFDEAFLSRFSIAIKYHELDSAGRCAVWRKFFELAGCRIEGPEDSDEFMTVDTSVVNISADELDELAEKLFNGRTIKNLVRTAQALALSQKKPLSAEHVKTVVRVQEKFLREFASTSLQ